MQSKLASNWMERMALSSQCVCLHLQGLAVSTDLALRAWVCADLARKSFTYKHKDFSL